MYDLNDASHKLVHAKYFVIAIEFVLLLNKRIMNLIALHNILSLS